MVVLDRRKASSPSRSQVIPRATRAATAARRQLDAIESVGPSCEMAHIAVAVSAATIGGGTL